MKNGFTSKKLCFCAAAIAISFITSNIKLIDMPLGGAVTLCSMLFICLCGYLFGSFVGFITALAYGTLQFITNPFILNIYQVICDYFLAFGSLGLAGLFHNKKHGLVIGYTVGVFGRFVFSALSGIVFFAEYAPASMGVFWYSICYNGAYLGLEAVITIIIILIPSVRKAIDRIKAM